MGTLQLIRIKNGVETVLEETPVPDSFTNVMSFYPDSHIKKLEERYQRTGKPKKSFIDAIYITRRQVERENKE